MPDMQNHMSRTMRPAVNDWSSEITAAPTGAASTLSAPAATASAAPAAASPAAPAQASAQTAAPAVQAAPTGMTLTSRPLNIRNNLPDEVLESPATMNEAYLGSMKAMLMRNRGNFVVATLLIGTQGTTSWEGELFDVGNDYIVIYQEGRDRYIACDIYSLKYIEFYDSRRREVCENLLRENGWQNIC